MTCLCLYGHTLNTNNKLYTPNTSNNLIGLRMKCFNRQTIILGLAVQDYIIEVVLIFSAGWQYNNEKAKTENYFAILSHICMFQLFISLLSTLAENSVRKQ